MYRTAKLKIVPVDPATHSVAGATLPVVDLRSLAA
jgi:hypothetical protein